MPRRRHTRQDQNKYQNSAPEHTPQVPTVRETTASDTRGQLSGQLNSGNGRSNSDVPAPKEKLPIEAFKEAIMASESPYIIIEAETGSGKSTMVPQWFRDAGMRVLVTEPLVETVIGTSEYVAEMRGGEIGGEVAYRTGEHRADSGNAKIMFCTDALALVRELAGHNSFDVLVIDELHEWNTNQSTLEAWAFKHMQSGDSPFKKIVVLSATLDSEELSRKRGNAPVFKVPGRQHPIEDRKAGADLISDVKKLVSEGYDVLVFQPGEKEILDTVSSLQGINAELIPFYGKLDRAQKNLAYKAYNRPKVIVSTNALETGRTVCPSPGRKLAVVDSGMERRIELADGIEGLYLKPIAKARSKQRRGRTGRVGEGVYIDHCKESQREDYPKPEIKRTRLDQTVLRLATVGYDATELPFFHDLDQKTITDAKRSLIALGAMTEDGKVTKTGQMMSRMPVDVRYARMAVEGAKKGVTDDVVTIAAIMEAKGLRDRSDKWKTYTRETESDLLAELDLWNASRGRSGAELREMGIFAQAVQRTREYRGKISEALARSGIRGSSSGNRTEILRSCVAGMVDHLYHRDYGYDYRNGGSGDRKLARESVVQGRPEWIVGIPKDISFTDKRGRQGVLPIVTMASKVDPAWLMEVAPQLVKKHQDNFSWNEEQGEVMADEVTVFNGNEVGRNKVVASPCEKACQVFVQYLAYGINQLPEAIAAVHEANVALTKSSEDLYYRSAGKAKSISRADLEARYGEVLIKLGVQSVQGLEAALAEGKFAPEELAIRLDAFISPEERAIIEAENPSEIKIGGQSFVVEYKSTWNGFEAEVCMSLAQLAAINDNSSEVRLPSGRAVTLKLSDENYSSLSSNSIDELREKAEKQRLSLAWRAFERERPAADRIKLEANKPLPVLPEPQIYDEQTGSPAYAACTINNWGECRLQWYQTEQEAQESQARVEQKQAELDKEADEEKNAEKYKAEARAVQAELEGCVQRIMEENCFAEYGYSDQYDYDFRYRLLDPLQEAIDLIEGRPLSALEKLGELKNMLEERYQTRRAEREAAEAKERELNARVEAGEILVNFTVWHRRGGMSGNGDGWVIRPDGTLREADSNDVRRYKSDGHYTWNIVEAEELALEWSCDTMRDVAGSSRFTVSKLPVGGCTPEQLARIAEIERDIEAPANSFGMNPELQAAFERRMKAVQQALQRSPILASIPEDLNVLALSGEWGVQIDPRYIRDGQALVNWTLPFDASCENRDAQLVHSEVCDEGVLEFLVYEKWGTTNLNIRWRGLSEGEDQPTEMSGGVAPEEAVPAEAEEVVDAMAALRAKFGQAIGSGGSSAGKTRFPSA